MARADPKLPALTPLKPPPWNPKPLAEAGSGASATSNAMIARPEKIADNLLRILKLPLIFACRHMQQGRSGKSGTAMMSNVTSQQRLPSMPHKG
jgi:hypothetical protein